MARLTARMRNRRWLLAAPALVLIAAVVGGFALAVRGGNDGPRTAGAPTPQATVTHVGLSEGWDAVDVVFRDEPYEMRALSVTDAGVATDSAFELTSDTVAIDVEGVASRIRVEPALEFEVEATDGGAKLRPLSALRRDTSYRFTLLDPNDQHELRTWAFQTESPLRVVQALPANQSINVPAHTGIELTFSHDGVQGVEDRFRIEPAVKGRFETHKRVVVFVPEDLAYQTLYTVTLDPGVSAGDNTTTEPYTFSFETGSQDRREDENYEPSSAFARVISESAVADAPVMQMFSPHDLDREFEFTVRAYDDAGDFIDALEEAQDVPQWSFWGRRDFRLDTSGLDDVATFNTKLVSQTGPYGEMRFAVFPEALEAGFYLVEADDGDETAQGLLQVTDLGAYATVSETKTLVWVNDLATQAPVDGARVSDQHGHDFSTGGDGVAFFDTPGEIIVENDGDAPSYDYYGYPTPSGSADGVFVVEHDGRTAVVPLRNSSPIGYFGYWPPYGRFGYGGGYYSGASPDFWSYVYTDRKLYRKTDEVHVWGVAKRRANFDDGEQVTVRVTSNDGYYGWDYQPSIVAETTASVGDLGTFDATVPLESLAAGYYSLSVVSGDETVGSAYFQVEDFVKPAYKIDIVPSALAAVAGDPVTMEITVAFFDGSPVPFMDLMVGGDFVGGEQQLRTDQAGKVSVTASPGANPDGVAYRYIYARPIGPEEGEINAEAYVHILPATVTMENIQPRVDAGTAIVTGSVHDVDFAAFDDIDDDNYGYYYPGYSTGYAGAPLAGRTVTANVIEVTYNKTEVREVYDFITKLRRKEYEYTRVETGIGAFTAVSAADGTFELRFPATKDRSYRIELTTPDGAGRLARAQTWVSGDELPYYPGYEDPFLTFSETNNVPDSNFGSGPPELYSDDETVDVTVRRGQERGLEGEGVRYLMHRAQLGIRGYEVQMSPRYQFAFDAGDAPNILVGGVQFNGRGYEQVMGEYNAAFDYKQHEIEIAVTADEQRYEPGADVTLTVETRDSSGAGVPAEVVLSGVDEAIIRLQGDVYEQDIVEALFGSLPSGVIATYVPTFTSAEQSLQSAYGGRGGGDNAASAGLASPDTGGSRSPRQDFRDVALFQTVRTDGDGRASVTFTLPDNITSWKVAAQGVTGDLRGGQTIADVPVGLPFFVEATISSEYLAADRPVIALRAFGADLTADARVTYRLRIPSLGTDEIALEGAAFDRTEVPLPSLSEGMHEVTIEASSGALQDAIVRDLRVVTSRVRRGDARYYELTEGLALEGATDGRTRVVFSDHNRGRHYDDLLRLGWTYGDRVDQMLARDLSQGLLRTYFDAEIDAADANFEPSLYQTDDGGIALFPYADDDLLLTARIAALAGDRFASERLQQYFGAVLDDPEETRERQIIALYGLAASGAPVIDSVRVAAASDGLTARERLYLGLAALAAGDEAIARDQYRLVVQQYGERRDPYVRLRVGTDQDDILEATSLAADLGAGLGDPSASAMFQYTLDNYATDLLVELEQISYLAQALPRLPSEQVKFSYVMNGERREETLRPGGSFRLDLSPDQLAALEPRTVEGAVGIATSFESPFDAASIQTDPDISITRVIDVDGGGIAAGDLVQVRLDYEIGEQALDGCYQITDIAPSGLRPVSRVMRAYDVGSYFDSLYPYLIDGQRVSFCAWDSDQYYPATYWARVVTTGDYAVEPAIMQSQRSATSITTAPAASVSIAPAQP